MSAMRWADDLDSKTLGNRTEDLGARDSQSRWGNVARRRFAELEGKALEACGRGKDQHAGLLDVDRERVRDPGPSEHKGSPTGFEHLIAHLERHLPVQDVPGFVLVVMNVERRLGAPKREPRRVLSALRSPRPQT